MKREKILDIDDEVFECFQSYIPIIVESEFKKKYPITFQVFMDFDISIHFIKNGIFEAAETENIVATKILTRSWVEHYLRFKYVFLNWVKTQTDESAEKYLIFSTASDEISNIKARIAEIQLYNPEFRFEKWSEILNKYSKTEIEKESNNFTYKNIIRFIIKSLNEKESMQSPFMNSMINEYARLSSYVHGGANAHIEIRQLTQNETERIAEIDRLCGLVAQCSVSVKLFTLLAILTTDKEKVMEHYKKMVSLSQKFPV